MLIAGVDLAWGERNRDGLCLLRLHQRNPEKAEVLLHAHTGGDDALLHTLLSHLAQPGEAVLVALDAPVVCQNATGRRPADAAVSAAFRHAHAGCYPVNQTLAQRPLRLARRLTEDEGFHLGPNPNFAPPWPAQGWRLAIEVFPHPALVRFFGLERILQYKRKAGRPTDHSAAEFRRLQTGLLHLASERFPELAFSPQTFELLSSPWSKAVEDQIDALVCALIGLWHLRYSGAQSEIFGDEQNGFVIVPQLGSQA